MAKAITYAALVAALFISGVNIGYHVQKDRDAEAEAKALAMCERSTTGTAFVSYRFGVYHCFYRYAKWPHRVAHSILVMGDDIDLPELKGPR